MTQLDTTAAAYALADRAVISDIECNCIGVRQPHDPARWYDTRPLLDPREYPDPLLEMNRQALDYADARGLITRHHDAAHMVRINPIPEPKP